VAGARPSEERQQTADGGAAKVSPGLTGLEEQDRNLSQVEVDEVLCLVGNVRSEVAANNAVPGRVVLFVELLLDERSDVLLDVVLLERLGGAVYGVLLHVLRHVGILDHGLAVSRSHGAQGRETCGSGMQAGFGGTESAGQVYEPAPLCVAAKASAPPPSALRAGQNPSRASL